MSNSILLALVSAHVVGMLVASLWFFPIYIKRQAKARCLNVIHYLGVILFGWISLLCLFIDLNSDRFWKD